MDAELIARDKTLRWRTGTPLSVGEDFPDEPGGAREAVERGDEEDGGPGGGREATSRP